MHVLKVYELNTFAVRTVLIHFIHNKNHIVKISGLRKMSGNSARHFSQIPLGMASNDCRTVTVEWEMNNEKIYC